MIELTVEQIKELFNSPDLVIDMDEVEYGYYNEVTITAKIRYKGVEIASESRGVTPNTYCSCTQY